MTRGLDVEVSAALVSTAENSQLLRRRASAKDCEARQAQYRADKRESSRFMPARLAVAGYDNALLAFLVGVRGSAVVGFVVRLLTGLA